MAKVVKQLLNDLSSVLDNSTEIVNELDAVLLNKLKNSNSAESYKAMSDLADECLVDLSNHCKT